MAFGPTKRSGLTSADLANYALKLPPVVTAAVSGNLSAAQVSGTFITNYGQTVANVQGLPPAVAGMSFELLVETVGMGAVSLDPNASEVVVLDGTSLTGGNKVTLATPALGDRITFRCLQNGTWYATAGQGTWTDGS